MPPAFPSPTPDAPMAALTPFAATVSPVSAMRAIGTTAPTINRSPLAASPPLLATQVSSRYRAGMHRAIDSITPYFVRLRRAAAPMESDASDFEGPGVSRAVLAPTAVRAIQSAPIASVSRVSTAARASSGAVWMARAATLSSAPLALPASFAPVSRSVLSGATPTAAAPSVFGGLSRVVESGGSKSVNRSAVPFTVPSVLASRSVLRNALPLPASGGPVAQTRTPVSAARIASLPALAPAHSALASPSPDAPTSTVSQRTETRSEAGFTPAATIASTAARSVSIADAPLARQVVPLLSRASTQAPLIGRVPSGTSSAATAQVDTFPTAITARNVAREPFAPVLSAARFIAPVAARNATVGARGAPTAQRASTPDLPAPGRPSVPQALWRQAAPDAPSPVERGSGADYVVSPPVPRTDFAPAQTAFATRIAPIEAHRSFLAPVARRGDSTLPVTPTSSAVVFRTAGDEAASAPSDSETTAPETAMRTLTPFVPRSAAPFISRAATMARAMALPATSAILSLTTAAFAQPTVAAQSGSVAQRTATVARPAIIANVPLVSRALAVDRAASETRSFAILPTFALTIPRVVAQVATQRTASFPVAQAVVNRQAAFVPAAQTLSVGTSAPFVMARAASPMLSVPMVSRNANAMYRTEDISETNASESFTLPANQSILETTPGFVPRQFDDSITSATTNGSGAAFLSPIAARAVSPLSYISRMPFVTQAASARASQPLLARQTVSPARAASRSFVPASTNATIARAFVPVTAFRAAVSETANETVPKPNGASVLRDFQIARVFDAPAFASTRSRPAFFGAPAPTSRSASSAAADYASTLSNSAPPVLSRHIARQSGGQEPRIARAALPLTTLVSRAPLTVAPFVLRSSDRPDDGGTRASAQITNTSIRRAEESPRAASRFFLSRQVLPEADTNGETDASTIAPSVSLAGVPSAARSAVMPPFAAPTVPLLRAPLSSALLNVPSAAQAARQNNETPREINEGMGTVVPRFVARITATAPFAPPVSAFVNRSTPSAHSEEGAFRTAGETGEATSASQLFSTRGAAYEMARTLRSGTLTTASLARQSAEESAFSVQRAVDGGGDAAGGAPAPAAGGEAPGGAGGGANAATDLMAIDRQVDVLWDRFMQRLRIEQERAGFH